MKNEAWLVIILFSESHGILTDYSKSAGVGGQNILNGFQYLSPLWKRDIIFHAPPAIILSQPIVTYCLFRLRRY